MRYLLLIIINLPIICLAFINTLTQYKMGGISKRRFRRQIIFWMVVFIFIIGSFPIYNYLTGAPPLDSSSLSLFDIIEITAIVYLVYVVNNQRRKIEYNEKLFRDLHQELSIKLSSDKD